MSTSPEEFEYQATTEHAPVMYHVTTEDSPQRGVSVAYDYTPAVYLFDDMRDAEEWKGYMESRVRQQVPVQIIALNVEGLPLKWDAALFDLYGHAWRYEGNPDEIQRTSAFEEYLAGALLPEVHLSFEKLASMYYESGWADVAAKAKRLVQQGKVTILRNAPHHIMAHVIGEGTDNGGTPDEHDVEISRHDPSSQIIEQWNCDCAWAQYSFDRTRKWKKFEGRPCSHVLATYWKARSTPLDLSDTDEGFQVPRGQKTGPAGPEQMKIPGMPGAMPSPEGLPRQFSPDEETPTPTNQPAPAPSQLPSTQDLTVPKQPESPFTQTPKAQPPQREQLQLFDITAPPGMQPMPAAQPVSVPGGRPPTPGNPVQFPGTFSHFIPVISIRSSAFIMAGDALTDYFETQRAAHMPIYVALTNTVALERSGGKIPIPGAQSYGTSSEGVPLYRVLDLGWNPATGTRENADVNVLQGAPEQTGTYSDVQPNRRAEVLDFDPSLKMAYVVVPLNYPDGGDVRLHPHSLKGWVDYADIRPVQQARSPWRAPR